MFSKILWYLRQLIPTTYRSRYSTDDGQRWFAVWNMWLGRVYNLDTVEVK